MADTQDQQQAHIPAQQRQLPTQPDSNDKVTLDEDNVIQQSSNDSNNNKQSRREKGNDVSVDKMSTDSVRGSVDQADEAVREKEISSPTASDHHVVFPAVDPREASSRKASHISSRGRNNHYSSAGGGSEKRTSSSATRGGGGQMLTGCSHDEGEVLAGVAVMRHHTNNNSMSTSKNLMPGAERWSMKSNGRKWMTSIKLSLWFTSVFTFVFCFFYFFLHVLLLVKVWDPVHTEPPVRDAGSQIDQFIDTLESDARHSSDLKAVAGAAAADLPIDDHRHSREKSIMSLILVLVLSFHSIIFYVFSSTLSKSIRTIDSYHKSLLDPALPPVYSIDPLAGHHSSHHHHHHRHSSSAAGMTSAVAPSGGQTHAGFQRHYRHPSSSNWKPHSLAEDHHEQYYYRKSRTRSRMDEEMGISRRDRRLLMYSFFGVLIALLCLLIHVMIQFVFCLALYAPHMDLMDCLLLIFSSFIIMFSLSFIFIASYYHRKKIYA